MLNYFSNAPLVLLCQFNMGSEGLSMNHARMGRSRSHSPTWRWMAGSEQRRRSGRGGKSRAGSAAGWELLTLAPRQPNQERVQEHDRQVGGWGKVAPEILPVAVAACGPLPNQPADMARAIAIDAPAAHCDQLGAQPTLTAFPPGQSRPWFERSPRPVLVPVGAAAHPAPRLAANTSVSQSDRRGCVPHNDN